VSLLIFLRSVVREIKYFLRKKRKGFLPKASKSSPIHFTPFWPNLKLNGKAGKNLPKQNM